jgi:predicted enzyme related to lactoylglutathione lyase
MPRVIHFEIHAENPERAVRFYSEVFGWSIAKWGGEYDYWLIETGPPTQPGINGGLVRRRGPGPVENQPVSSYVCTMDVPSADDYARKITEHGGTIAVPKMPIPGVGWLVYAKDTEGNIFGIMQADERAGQ